MPDRSAQLESAATADGLTEDRWLGGRLVLLQPKRGHRVGTDAALLVAAAGDARQGRIVDVGAGVGAVGLALAAARSACLASILSNSIPSWRGSPKSNAARNGLQARTRVLRLDALNPKERREAGLAEFGRLRRHQPAVLRRQGGPRLSGQRQGAGACLSPRRGGRGACRLDSGFACDSRAGRAVCDDPPARRAERDPRRDRKPARRAGASAGSSDDRRERASSAGLGRERLQGPAAPCAGARFCTGPTAA